MAEPYRGSAGEPDAVSSAATAREAEEAGRGLEEAIRRRAYEIWEEEGRPEERAEDHWLRAEAELLGKAEGWGRQRGSA